MQDLLSLEQKMGKVNRGLDKNFLQLFRVFTYKKGEHKDSTYVCVYVCVYVYICVCVCVCVCTCVSASLVISLSVRFVYNIISFTTFITNVYYYFLFTIIVKTLITPSHITLYILYITTTDV